MGILQLSSSESGAHETLPSPHDIESSSSHGGMPNPLASTEWTRPVLQKLIGMALLGSTAITLYLAYILPGNFGPFVHLAIFLAAGILLPLTMRL